MKIEDDSGSNEEEQRKAEKVPEVGCEDRVSCPIKEVRLPKKSCDQVTVSFLSLDDRCG